MGIKISKIHYGQIFTQFITQKPEEESTSQIEAEIIACDTKEKFDSNKIVYLIYSNFDINS